MNYDLCKMLHYAAISLHTYPDPSALIIAAIVAIWDGIHTGIAGGVVSATSQEPLHWACVDKFA